MFERLQKPFLTVETGEAYQPIRITYDTFQLDAVIDKLNSLKCCEKNPKMQTWHWYWRDECNDLRLESLDSFKKDPARPIRLGTFVIRDNKLYLSLPSFKRACLAVPFFHRTINPTIARAHHADFINKVFGIDERLPHGFTELFDDTELDNIIKARVVEYDKMQDACEQAESADDAIAILAEYAKRETQKRLPYAERYEFDYTSGETDPDILFLSFYIFLRSRELVAIRRWFGDANFTLADAADETIEKVFGGMDLDIIE